MDPFPKKHPQGLPICPLCGRGIRKPAAHGENAPYCNRVRWMSAAKERRDHLTARGYETAGDAGRLIRTTRVPWIFGPGSVGMGGYESAITTWAPTWSIEIARCFKVSTTVRRRWLEHLLDHPEAFVELDAVRRLGGTRALAAYLKQTKDPAK